MIIDTSSDMFEALVDKAEARMEEAREAGIERGFLCLRFPVCNDFQIHPEVWFDASEEVDHDALAADDITAIGLHLRAEDDMGAEAYDALVDGLGLDGAPLYDDWVAGLEDRAAWRSLEDALEDAFEDAKALAALDELFGPLPPLEAA